MGAQPLRIADETPDFMARSVLEIAPGKWRMRNGHIAHIAHQKNLAYTVGGKSKMFPIWVGDCLNCKERKAWNINGTYAACGRHALDIVGPAE